MSATPGETGIYASLKDIVLFALAIYGAGLSTFNLIQSLRRERRQILVRVSTVMPEIGGRLGQCFAKVEAVNTGHRPVTVTNLTLELSSGTRLLSLQFDRLPVFPDTRLPAVINDGQAAHVLIPYAEIGAALLQAGVREKTRLVPLCEDSVGHIHRGEPWELDPAEIARM
jgi:hypothetical protein